MQQGNRGMGMQKHRKSGKVPSTMHFSGKKGGKRVRRKGKSLTRKQRRQNQGTHLNKYSGQP